MFNFFNCIIHFSDFIPQILLRRILGPKREPLRITWRQFLNEQLHNSYASSATVTLIQLRTIKYTRHCRSNGKWTLPLSEILNGSEESECLDPDEKIILTFRNFASHIQDGRKITLQMPHFIFIRQISVLNILNILYNLHFFLFKMPFIS